MSHTIEATFDGVSFHPTEPVVLPANTKVRITIEPTVESAPPSDDPYAFLKILSEAKIEGPPDWSENVDKYLYGPLHESREE